MKINEMFERGAYFMAATCLATLLSACGSGAVSSSSDPTIVFTLSPANATSYSGVPLTLTISGGGVRPPYLITTSNATLLPISVSSTSESQLVLTPGTVTTQQSGTISISDQAGKTASATITVLPNLINSDITVTGSAPPAFPTCAGVGVVCAGQSGTATLTVSQNGAPARGRSVRFDVVQGAYRFPVDISQTTFSTSVTVTSDESGRATTVLRADTGASPQIATIRATDTLTGAFRIATFFIKQPQVSGGEFVTVPAEWKVSGTYKGTCPGGAVDFLIFGGSPPYTIRSSAPAVAPAFPSVTPVENPSRFSVSFPSTSCGTAGYQVIFTVTDATGLSIQSTLSNTPGTDDPPALPPVISLAPPVVTLACSQSTQVLVTITNPGTTAPTITTSIGTPLSSASALSATVSASGVITLVRGAGSIGSTVLPAGTPVSANVIVGAGSAAPQSLTVTTPYSCP